MFRTIARATYVDVTVYDEGDKFVAVLGVLREEYIKDDKMRFSVDAAVRIVSWFHQVPANKISTKVQENNVNTAYWYRVSFTRLVEELDV